MKDLLEFVTGALTWIGAVIAAVLYAGFLLCCIGLGVGVPIAAAIWIVRLLT